MEANRVATSSSTSMLKPLTMAIEAQYSVGGDQPCTCTPTGVSLIYRPFSFSGIIYKKVATAASQNYIHYMTPKLKKAGYVHVIHCVLHVGYVHVFHRVLHVGFQT